VNVLKAIGLGSWDNKIDLDFWRPSFVSFRDSDAGNFSFFYLEKERNQPSLICEAAPLYCYLMTTSLISILCRSKNRK